MNALSFVTGFFAAPECAVRTEPRRCLRNRLSDNRCDLCLRVCPSGALSYRDGLLCLDTLKCSGCLRCTALCPSDALIPHADLQLHDALRKRDKLLISCERQRLFREEEIVVPCLAMFSHELLLYFFTFSAAQTIRFNISGCRSCDNEKACREFERDLQCVRQRGGLHRLPRLEVLTEEKREKGIGNRRSFLRSLGTGALQAATSPSGREHAQPEIPDTSRMVPRKTQLLKEIMEVGNSQHPLAAAMIRHVHISDDCVPCPRCAGICPTGALKLVRLEQGKKLEFDATSCNDCGLCVEFCKEQALSLSCSLED